MYEFMFCKVDFFTFMLLNETAITTFLKPKLNRQRGKR